MADSDKSATHKFVEGIGGRLAESKSQSYARAVLGIEGRNNPYLAKYMLMGDLACVLSAWELGVTPDDAAKSLIRCLLDLIPRAEELGQQGGAGDIVLQREFWIADAVGQEVGLVAACRPQPRREPARIAAAPVLPRSAVSRKTWRCYVWCGCWSIAPSRCWRRSRHSTTICNTPVAPRSANICCPGRRAFTAISNGSRRPTGVLISRRRRIAAARSWSSSSTAPAGASGFSRVARLWEECFITEEHFSEPFFVLVQIAVALGRLAEDLRLWMTAEFDFFELADEHASGSSGRPQKKNPFGLQAVINGAALGAGRLAAQFATNITVSEEADTTYHAYTMYQFARDVAAWTDFMADVIEKGDFKLAELERKSAFGYAGAREALDVLVYEHRVPYRYAHRCFGELVRMAEEERTMPPWWAI